MVSLRSNALVFEFLARDRASRTFDKFGGKTNKLTAKLGRLAKRATMAAGIAGAAFGVHAVKGFLSFDDAMTSSLAIMGDVSGPMRKKMEDAARQIAKTTRFSASEAAEAYFFLASTGMDAEQSIAAIPQVAAFAQAGLFDMAKATELAVDAQKAMGMGAQDAGENLKNLTQITDVLVKANTLSNATVEEFAAALTNKAAPALRSVNKDVEEGVAVLAALASQGQKGKAAGLALSITLRELSRRAITHEAAFKKANITVFDANGNMRNMADIVGDLENRFEGMSDKQQRSELMMLGFTDRSIQVILNLLGMSDAIREYESELREAGDTTQEIAENQLQSFQAKIDILKSHVTDFAITLGGFLVDNLFKAGEALAPFAKNIIKEFETIKPEIQRAWGEVLDLLFGPRAMASTEEEMSGIRIGGGLLGAVQEFGREWSAKLIEGITTGVDSGDFGPLGEAVGEKLGEALSRSVDLAGKFLEWLGGVNWAEAGVKAGQMIIPFAVGLVAGLVDSVLDPDMWAQIASQWHVLLGAALALAFAPGRVILAVGRILARIPFVGTFLSWLFKGFASMSKAVVPAVLKFVGNLFKAFLNGLTRGRAGRVIDKFVDWLKLFPTRIGLAALWIRDAGIKFIQGLGKAILGAAKGLGKVIGEVIKFLTWPFRKAGGWLLSKGKALITGLKDGIWSVAKSIGAWIKKNAIDRSTKPFVGAARWLVDAGKKVVNGLKNGITAIAKSIGAWIKKNVIDKIINQHANAVKWLVSAGKRVVNGLKDGISNVMSTIRSWLKTNIKDKVLNYFSKAKDWLFSSGKSLLRGLKDGMLDLLKKPLDFFKSIGTKIVSGVKSFFGIKSPSKVFAGLGRHLITGFIKGMITSGKGLRSVVRKVFGSMPKALGGLITKGLIGVSKLPGKAMSALEGLGNAASSIWSKIFGEDSGQTTSRSGDFGFVLPRGSYRVGQGLGAGRGHTGQDFPAAAGTPVFAPFAGMLTNKDLGNRSYGKYANLVSGAWRFIGAHLSRFARGPGPVSKGDLIGFVGSTGRSTGNHLHAEFRHGGKVVNPRNVLSFATGGFPKSGSFAWVGENGPELVRFNTPNARVFSNQESRKMVDTPSGSDGDTITYEFYGVREDEIIARLKREDRIKRARGRR